MHEERSEGDQFVVPPDGLVVEGTEPDLARPFNGFEEPDAKVNRDAGPDHEDPTGREPDDDAYIGGPVEVDYDTGEVREPDEVGHDVGGHIPQDG